MKPDNKTIDFKTIDKIIVILPDENLLTPIFMRLYPNKNYPNIPKIDFIYSLNEINSNIETH